MCMKFFSSLFGKSRKVDKDSSHKKETGPAIVQIGECEQQDDLPEKDTSDELGPTQLQAEETKELNQISDQEWSRSNKSQDGSDPHIQPEQSTPEGSRAPIRTISADKELYKQINFNIDIYKDLNPPLNQARLKGEGGFGKVYKSSYKGRLVAVKVFNVQYQTYFDAGGATDEFLKELDIICRLHHDHIVSCYGASMKPGEKAIIMEYVENSLHDLIHKVKRPGRMKLSSIYKIIKSIAKALEFLHQLIVHRDLHPLNVLISKDGLVKVADFGISRMMEHSTTIVSDYKGAPAYIAPEIFEHNKLSFKSDIYSLGIIAWELWSLEMPWKGQGYGVVVDKVCKGERPDFPDDIPPNLRSLIERCWKQDYSQRPDARQVYLECNRVLAEIEEQRRT